VRFAPSAPGQGGTFDELYALLDEDLRGTVLVLAGAESVVGAVWGQILSCAALRAGALAVVVAGSVRDIAEQRDSAVQVWACSEHTMGATGQARIAGIDETVRIADVTIAVGDQMVIDEGGVVCLHSDQAEDLLAQAQTYADAEARLLADLSAGVPLAQAYDHKRAARRQLDAWYVERGDVTDAR
jgi:4-hydroxy-4-methyl-2-oxoglutarate aldolase